MAIDPTAPGGSVATTPGKTTDSGQSGGLSQNYQDFLKLLTTQLQNQDPTSPTDTNQLTQQIATLSSVEQQINMNKNLEALLAAYQSSESNTAVGYIGAQIETEGDQVVVSGTEGALVYYLPEGAASAEITVKDASGATVFTANGTNVAGRNQVIWNAKNTAGELVPEGAYTFTVKVKDSAGKAITEDVTTRTTGIVKSVEKIDGKNTLSLGPIQVDLDDVLSVRNPQIA